MSRSESVSQRRCCSSVFMFIGVRRRRSGKKGKIGDNVYISRLSLTPSSDTRIPFIFQRRQFSIFVCFVMTINKNQGQSRKQVAISRVTSMSGLKILLIDEDGLCMW
ncbi:hypothetical protein MTR_6g086110 [Medicago truncatula]|uniref:Uncharacterized protein n=1 Tax=Medicago truncatula TaxID=3880 RepID=G7KNG5_MEDTR|nr:hypothetical protein MTR_6g086110 [Medicago truncatula]